MKTTIRLFGLFCFVLCVSHAARAACFFPVDGKFAECTRNRSSEEDNKCRKLYGLPAKFSYEECKYENIQALQETVDQLNDERKTLIRNITAPLELTPIQIQISKLNLEIASGLGKTKLAIQDYKWKQTHPLVTFSHHFKIAPNKFFIISKSFDKKLQTDIMNTFVNLLRQSGCNVNGKSIYTAHTAWYGRWDKSDDYFLNINGRCPKNIDFRMDQIAFDGFEDDGFPRDARKEVLETKWAWECDGLTVTTEIVTSHAEAHKPQIWFLKSGQPITEVTQANFKDYTCHALYIGASHHGSATL